MNRYICIHGHFYQPPRENPWLEAIELQDSAYPFHDWNERVNAECYAPNTASRILDDRGRIVDIVNNFAKISFNVGPTLLAWLADKQPDVYAAILAADRDSVARFSGHGLALAQAYNHLIMPLAKRRDKVTQARWGVADFRHRFGRAPEGLWLPETAVDLETLDVLAEEGIAFTVLEPHQAARMRHVGERDWHDVGGARIDPTTTYKVRLPSGKFMALFFYDGPISRAVAFEHLLTNGETFARRLLAGFSDGRGWEQLVHIATDGETYGHHHRFGDMALAFALDHIERHELARLTNYGEYLASHPPAFEVQIAEKTSWSCAHGIERWRADCGCNTGSHPGWRQTWRGPLRAALDRLRDTLAELYVARAGPLLRDPWAARDDYIRVILDRSRDNVADFLAAHAVRSLTAADEVAALKLLEMQRHALLMYTSCGWFFDDISGIESVQVLQYAGRALQLAQAFTGESLEPAFLRALAKAPSNVPEHGDGAKVFRTLVKPAMADLYQVGAHYAITSMFDDHNGKGRVFGYTVDRLDYKIAEAGRARLAVGRIAVASEVTHEVAGLAFGALHLGDHNLSGGVRDFPGEEAYRVFVADAMQAFNRADLPAALRVLDRNFDLSYSIKSLFRDEQRRIMATILDATLADTAGEFRELYQRHAPLMRFLADLAMPLPRALLATAEFHLNTELREAFRQGELPLERVHELLEQARRTQVPLDASGLAFALEGALERAMNRVLAAPAQLDPLQAASGAVGLARALPFPIDLWRAQNLFFALPAAVIAEQRVSAGGGDPVAQRWVTCYDVLGELLSFKVG